MPQVGTLTIATPVTNRSRKAALSHIHAGAFASAQHELDQCPSNEATTQYLSFLVAVHEGREVAG